MEKNFSRSVEHASQLYVMTIQGYIQSNHSMITKINHEATGKSKAGLTHMSVKTCVALFVYV